MLLRRFHRLLDPTGITEGLAVAGAVTALASAGVGAASAMNQAHAQQQADNYNAQVAANNAQVAAWQRQQQDQEAAQAALATQEQGAAQASQLQQQTNVTMARNIAAAAASGLQITGSTADVISGTAQNQDLQVLQSQYKTGLDAWQQRINASNASYNSVVQAGNYSAQAALDRMAASNAEAAGMFSATGSIISGLGGVGQSLSSQGGQALLGTSSISQKTPSTYIAYQNGLFD